jgi:hypothetical protein
VAEGGAEGAEGVLVVGEDEGAAGGDGGAEPGEDGFDDVVVGGVLE